MNKFLHFWSDQQGQDIAEYAVMLAVILVLVVGTIPTSQCPDGVFRPMV